MKNIMKTTAAQNTLETLKKVFGYRETMINAEWLVHICPSAVLIWRSDYKPL